MPLQSGNVHSWWCAFQEALETAASRSPHEIPLLFANPNLKFGVNCYGIKPKAKQRELDMMEANKTKILPHSKNQIAAERKIDFWKENADKLLSINAHNSDSWSRYWVVCHFATVLF